MAIDAIALIESGLAQRCDAVSMLGVQSGPLQGGQLFQSFRLRTGEKHSLAPVTLPDKILEGFAGVAGEAAVRGNELLLSSPQDALDLIATARYETGCEALILPKEIVSEDFFILSSGLAGEVLQKFVNYSMKVAIVGDFSRYTS